MRKYCQDVIVIFNNKTCSKCHETKPLDEFYKQKKGKFGKHAACKKCSNEESRNYSREHKKERKEYQEKYNQEHKDEIIKKKGNKSMYKNKTCSQYLGIVIGERLLYHLFKNVEVMPRGNIGYDFICNNGKKIDVKTSCLTLQTKRYPHWKFKIKQNKVADFFILVAFDNRINLKPLHIWIIPGKEINENESKSIRPSTVHKWNRWKRSIEEVQMCCTEMKNKSCII